MKTPVFNSLKKLLFAAFTVAAIFISFTNTHHEPVAILAHPDIDSPETMTMTADDFGKSTGVTLMVKGDYEVARFNVVYVPKTKDPVEVVCRSAKYSDRALNLVDEAASGDVYYFEKITAKTPDMKSEEEWLKLNSLVIKIK
ncbi:MAG: GldM family protein [Bacteroidota bacterium]